MSDDLKEIRAAIEGDDGIRVRLALAEAELKTIAKTVADVRTDLLEHRKISTIAHGEALSEIRAIRSETYRIDAATARWIGIAVAAALSALGVGGGVASRLADAAEATPAAADSPAEVRSPDK